VEEIMVVDLCNELTAPYNAGVNRCYSARGQVDGKWMSQFHVMLLSSTSKADRSDCD
jgi:hypothetical protein